MENKYTNPSRDVISIKAL